MSETTSFKLHILTNVFYSEVSPGIKTGTRCTIYLLYINELTTHRHQVFFQVEDLDSRYDRPCHIHRKATVYLDPLYLHTKIQYVLSVSTIQDENRTIAKYFLAVL